MLDDSKALMSVLFARSWAIICYDAVSLTASFGRWSTRSGANNTPLKKHKKNSTTGNEPESFTYHDAASANDRADSSHVHASPQAKARAIVRGIHREQLWNQYQSG